MNKIVVILCLLFTPLLGYSQDTYVLIHGAWADAHAWDMVKPNLEEQGFKVFTPNLPAHGQDTTSISRVTLDTYVQQVKQIINQQQDKVILVGHSMAGMIVAQVAEEVPEKIKYLVYVAAYVPKDGQSLTDIASADSLSTVGKNLIFSEDYSSATINKGVLVDAICADCPQQIKENILKYHKGEPAAPLNEAVSLTNQNYGSVPKYYIKTEEDRAVTSQLQTAMTGGFKKSHIYSMDTSHLPFLSKPDEFLSILKKIRNVASD